MTLVSDPLTAWKRPRVRVGAKTLAKRHSKRFLNYSVGDAHAAVGDSPLQGWHAHALHRSNLRRELVRQIVVAWTFLRHSTAPI